MKANIPNTIRKSVYRRDGYRCAICDNTQTIQIHHYIPRGKGGSNSPQNLITLCSTCHALAHGTNLIDGSDFTQEDMEQAILEYLADYYAPGWHPDDIE